MAEPDEYFKSATLKLFFNSKDDCSVDEAGAVKFGGTKADANTHGTWVQQVQKDLIAIGYLPEKDNKGVEMADGYYGRSTARAILRFQRHAARVYRMDKAKAIQDVPAAEVFAGKETGICDPDTAKEIRKWIDKSWVNPVGRFALEEIKGEKGAQMRPDAAAAWEKIMADVETKGGSLKGPYGNTFRRLADGGGAKGSSKWSVHHSGRAVDINQAKKFVVKDPDAASGKMFWRVFQKTDKQDGTQGAKIAKGAHKVFNHRGNSESDIPEAFYLELTAEIQAGGEFKRISAQSDWENRKPWEDAQANLKKVEADPAATAEDKQKAQKAEATAYQTLYNKQEWWHFQFSVDMQPTFIDELELIGFSEPEVRKVKDKDGALKWPDDADLDHRPG
jgi:hypothetical protein